MEAFAISMPSRCRSRSRTSTPTRIVPARYLPEAARGDSATTCSATRACPDGREPGLRAELPAWRRPGSSSPAAISAAAASREHAVWALYDTASARDRAVLRRHLPERLKNGLLPVVLPAEVVAEHAWRARGAARRACAVDLRADGAAPDGTSHAFAIDPFANTACSKASTSSAYTLTCCTRSTPSSAATGAIIRL